MFQQTQTKSYMQDLNDWIDVHVLGELFNAWRVEPITDPRIEAEQQEAAEKVKRMIREKVLESYRNGQAAGPAKSDNRRRYAKR